MFIGANDGASGVAMLMELAKWMPKLESKYGVDFVLFDGEEFVFRKGTRFDRSGDPMFLGAEHFAKQYVGEPPAYKYRWGVLLDMVGSENLQLHKEGNSVAWRDTRPLVDRYLARGRPAWGSRIHPARARTTSKTTISALHDIGKIPTCDIIDFSGYDRLLAHPERHAGALLAVGAGQGRLGHARVAEAGRSSPLLPFGSEPQGRRPEGTSRRGSAVFFGQLSAADGTRSVPATL